MKTKNNSRSGAVSGPLLDRIVELDKANFRAQLPDVTIGSKPLVQSALYQDPGGAYNANLTYPQE